MACSEQQSVMYPLVLGAVLASCHNNRVGGPQARESLQKEKERREAEAATVERVRSEYTQVGA